MAGLLISGLFSFLSTPVAVRVARRLNVFDVPHEGSAEQKSHKVPTPYLGGLAILFGTLAPSALLPFASVLGEAPTTAYVIVGVAALLLAGVGLLDDLVSLPPSVRISAQLSAALAVWLSGFRVDIVSNDFLNLALTIVWVVGITNAFNLLDNMDGLSAGIAVIACFAFTALALLNDLTVLPLLSASLGGACLGFLIHNRPPAKIFMGDAGSLFIGFIIALLGLKLRFSNLLQVNFLIPVVVLGVPILDTCLVVFSRRMHKRPIFLGGRDHASHRLVAMGLSTPSAVGLLYLGAACLAWLAIVISLATHVVAFMLTGFIVAVGIFFVSILFRVPVYGNPSDAESDLGPEPS